MKIFRRFSIAALSISCISIQQSLAQNPGQVSSFQPLIVAIAATSNRSPSGETVERAIDGNPNTKYLNFDKFNTGFTIRLSSSKVIQGIQLTTANDFSGRDPTSFSLSGSNDGNSWTAIVTDQSITLPAQRKVQASVIAIANADAYLFYKLVFPTVKNMSRSCGLDCDSMQIADVLFSFK